MLTAENEMDCCLNSPTQTVEHSDSLNVCVCVPLPVIFVVAIILLSFLHFCRLIILSYNEEYFFLAAPPKSKSVKPYIFTSIYRD